MTEQTVTLRITGENGKLVATVRASKAELDSLGKSATNTGRSAERSAGQVERLGNSAGKTGQQARRGAADVQRIGDASDYTRRRASLLTGTLGGLKQMLAGYVGVQTVGMLSRTADTYTDIIGKLQQVTKGEEELAFAKAQTYRIAQQTYQQLDATVTLYSRSAQALAQYNVGQQAVAQLTQTINQGLLVSRATTAESASAVLQLSQAFGAGALRGEEFNAVNEAAPRLMQALADSMGVPRGALKKLAEDGKLTIDELLKAWTGPQAAKIAEEASKVPLTISRAWQRAKNEMLQYVGENDQAEGASAQIAQSLLIIARHIPEIASGLLTITKITAAWFLAFRVAPAVFGGIATGLLAVQASAALATPAMLAFQRSVLLATSSVTGARLATVAFSLSMNGAAIAAASFGVAMKAAAAVGLAAFAGWQIGSWLRENFLEARLFGIAFIDGMLKGWQYLKAGALVAWEGIKAGFLGALNIMRTGLAELVAFNASVAEAMPGFLADGAAAELRALEQALRPTTSAADDLAAATARINAERDREIDAIHAITNEMADYEIAQAASAAAARDGADAANGGAVALGNLALGSEKAAEKLRKLLAAQAEFARDNRRMAAALSGPEEQAWFEYDDGVRTADEALRKHEATLSEVTLRKRLLATQLRQTLDALADEADVLGRLEREYEQQVYLSGLSARARRVEEQVMRAVAEANRLAVQHGNDEIRLTPQRISQLRSYIAEREREIEFNEASQRAAQVYQDKWRNAVDSVQRAFADWMSGGISSFKDFGKTLVDIAKRYIADVLAEFAKGQLAKTFQGWMGSIGNWLGGSSGSGNWVGTVARWLNIGGNGGFGAAGGTGSWWGQLGSMVGQYLGFGGAASGAAGAGSLMGFGNVGNLAGVAGAGAGLGGAGSAGGATAGASSTAGAAAAAAWVVAILAGMYMGSQWYKEGWQAEGQWGNINGATNGPTPGMIVVHDTENVLRALGVNDKWAAILSGSSGIARAFGHGKPHLYEQGIQGSVGFDGNALQDFAVIKQKGGWFRSDKYTTQTGTVNGVIGRAFDMAAEQVRTRAVDLAKQAGMDISAALRTVRVDVGRLVLEADPEKARAQIERKLEEIAETLGQEAVKALGFARLLDDGFRAGEIMATLSVAMELVTGGTEKLGRALTALEKENVARAVEYFEGLSIKNGTSLGAEVERVVGTLSEYAQLVTGIDTQLKTSGLSQYQRAQLDIEMTYRNQIKQANALARSLGLTGARAEDLAKIEQLRALNMANLQQQLEQQKSTFLADLGLSELSPLTDAQKLTESMQMLRDAVGIGDMQRAQSLAQTTLGLGRNLYASGNDYAALYDQVTGLIGGMTVPGLDGSTSMSDLAEILLDLPDGIAMAMFNMLYPQATATPATPPPPPVAPPSGGGGSGGGGTGPVWRNPHEHVLMERMAAGIDQLVENSHTTVQQGTSSRLDLLNRRLPV